MCCSDYEPFEYTPKVAAEIRRRIRLSLAAYTYEYLGETLMSDAEFDRMSLEVDLSIDTNRPDLDRWFRREFDPSTGMWIRDHPELAVVANRAKWLLKHGQSRAALDALTGDA